MNRLALRLLRHTPWVIAGCIIVAMVVLVPAFGRLAYWFSLSQHFFAPAALALALTPVILTGGIDLSVGAVAVFSSVVIGALWQGLGWPLPWALAGGVAAGLVAGAANGLLVTAGVLPLVATLATRELFRGLAWTLSGDTPVSGFPPALGAFWRRPALGLPVSLLGLAGLFLLTYLVVHHTWAGRMLFALGDNERAARFAGVPVRGVKLGLYAWSGFVAGLCGLTLVLRYGVAKPDAEKSLELTAIACVVLGGIRITGGAGHVAGTLLGVVTVCTLMAGLNSYNSTLRDTVSGTILVAVAVTNEAASRWAALRGEEQPAPGILRGHRGSS
jgi:ribose/xylose/arabinose/galactoside ABC-type transport system permease subunit